MTRYSRAVPPAIVKLALILDDCNLSPSKRAEIAYLIAAFTGTTFTALAHLLRISPSAVSKAACKHKTPPRSNGGNGEPFLVDELLKATPDQRREAARKFGVSNVWAEMVEPLI